MMDTIAGGITTWRDYTHLVDSKTFDVTYRTIDWDTYVETESSVTHNYSQYEYFIVDVDGYNTNNDSSRSSDFWASYQQNKMPTFPPGEGAS